MRLRLPAPDTEADKAMVEPQAWPCVRFGGIEQGAHPSRDPAHRRGDSGIPLGRSRFAAETGIHEHDWRGRFWARWSDALREAGLSQLASQDS